MTLESIMFSGIIPLILTGVYIANKLTQCRDHLYHIQDFAEKLNMAHGLTDEQFKVAIQEKNAHRYP